MTNYPADNGGYLVEVQAQVMTRDHSTRCWVPMGGGGLSIVKLCKLLPPNHTSSSPPNTPPKAEYLIHGERLADKSVVLDCVLTKDIQYTKANPKFHHWNSDDKRFGLTFERCDDARAFDLGIRHAVAELNEGVEGEETIFQVVDLPVGGRKNSSSQSASTTSTTTNSPSPTSPLPHHPFPSFPHPHANHNHLHLVHYMPAHKPRHGTGVGDSEKEEEGVGGYVYGHRTPSPHPSDTLDSWGMGEEVWVRYEDYAPPKAQGHLLLQGGGEGGYKDEPYVIFAKNKAGAPHEYSYPSLEPGVHNPPAKRECTATRKQPLLCQPHPPLPCKTSTLSKGKGEQSRRLVAQCAQCRHCRVMFSVEDNHRGSCDSAPDAVTDCIECVTCVSCTKPLFYHCCADADGQYSHPCQCQATEDSHCRKWTALTLLSCLLPCLWCYPPLTACHRAAVCCGLCGGRHKAA